MMRPGIDGRVQGVYLPPGESERRRLRLRALRRKLVSGPPLAPEERAELAELVRALLRSSVSAPGVKRTWPPQAG